MFHLFHSVRKFPWVFCLAWCLAGVWVLFGCWGCWFALWWFFVVGFCFQGNLSQSQLIPVVDRPCLALVRQCRKKKTSKLELRKQRLSNSCLQTGLGKQRSRNSYLKTGAGKALSSNWGQNFTPGQDLQSCGEL